MVERQRNEKGKEGKKERMEGCLMEDVSWRDIGLHCPLHPGTVLKVLTIINLGANDSFT